MSILIPADIQAKVGDNPDCPQADVAKLSACPIELESRLASKNLRDLILNNIPNLMFGLVGTVALIMFFINAIRYLISAGNQEGTGLAKTGMLMAIIGLVITLAAFTIVSSVKNLLGP